MKKGLGGKEKRLRRKARLARRREYEAERLDRAERLRQSFLELRPNAIVGLPVFVGMR